MDHSPPGSTVHGDSPVKNNGVGCHDLLQEIFPTQGSNPGLLHWWWIVSIYKWYHIFVFLCQTYFTYHDNLQLHPWLNFVLFYGWLVSIVGVCVCTTSSLSSVDGHLGCFHVSALVSSIVMNIMVTVFFWITILSRYMPSSGIDVWYSNSIFNCLRKFHTVLFSGIINLHSYQKCRSITFSLCPLQNLLFVDKHSDQWWYLIVDLICISLIISTSVFLHWEPNEHYEKAKR